MPELEATQSDATGTEVHYKSTLMQSQQQSELSLLLLVLQLALEDCAPPGPTVAQQQCTAAPVSVSATVYTDETNDRT